MHPHPLLTPLEAMKEMQHMSKHGALSPRAREKLRRLMVDVQTAENLTGREMARILQCGPSMYSQIKQGKYKGNEDVYLRRFQQWMIDRKARVETPATEYADTSVGRRVMKVCRRCWEMPSIGIIVTPSGAGKTEALREFARRRGDRALYLAAGVCFSTQAGLIAELAGRLGVPTTSRSTAATLYRGVRDRLADYYAGGKADPFCILIDEATTLHHSAKTVLRNLHDDPEVRCAVVFADTARLDVELRGRSGRAMYEQLRSRAGAQFLMAVDDEIPVRDVRAVADSVLSGLGHSSRLRRESYTYLHRLAQADGKLRNVVHRLWAVHDVAAGVGSRPAYSVAELDFVAPLVGGRCEIEHAGPPFGDARGRPGTTGPTRASQRSAASQSSQAAVA